MHLSMVSACKPSTQIASIQLGILPIQIYQGSKRMFAETQEESHVHALTPKRTIEDSFKKAFRALRATSLEENQMQ